VKERRKENGECRKKRRTLGRAFPLLLGGKKGTDLLLKHVRFWMSTENQNQIGGHDGREKSRWKEQGRLRGREENRSEAITQNKKGPQKYE